MKIQQCNNFNNINFSGNKEKIKKADDMMRLSKKLFPSTSLTHIREYRTFDDDVSEDDYTDAYKRLVEKISLVRNLLPPSWKDSDEYESESQALREKTAVNESYYFGVNRELSLLSKIKEMKVANCDENVRCAIAVFAANGIYNAVPVSLYLNVRFINKKGEVQYETDKKLDHKCMLTSLDNKDVSKKEYKYVVDPWLTFASSKEKAIDYYYGYFDKTIEKKYNEAKDYFFNGKNVKNTGTPFDYDIQSNLILMPNITNMWKTELKDLGKFTKKLFMGENE